MRKCKCRIYKDGIYLEIIGGFHQWGTEVIESDMGNTMYTVAIVETEDGEVYTTNPNWVKFINE